MDCIDELVKAGLPSVEVVAPWIRVDFDRDRKIVGRGFFVRRRSLLVNPRGQAACETVIHVPEDRPTNFKVTVRYRLYCPLNQEQDVARALYDPDLTPKEVLDRYVVQAAAEYVIRVVEERFLAEFTQRHRNGLRDHLETRLAVLSRLRVERLTLETTEPTSSIPFALNGRRVDLADNWRGAPVNVAVNLDLDQGDSRLMALATRYVEREGELQYLVPQWVDTFFRGVKLNQLLDETNSVEANLRADLTIRAAAWGRIVGRLSLARPAIEPKPVEDSFDCWLADQTNLHISVRGALWLSAGGPEGQPAPDGAADPWPILSEVMKVRTNAILDRHTYFEFEAERENILQQMVEAVRDHANRMGIGVSLQLRHEWDHAWLLPGLRISREVSCTVRNGSIEGRVKVLLECVIEDKIRAPWQKMSQAQLEDALNKLVDGTVTEQVGVTELKDYVEFDELERHTAETLRREVRNRFGLAIASMRINRTDDWPRKSREAFLKEAPRFIVEHPRFTSLRFEVQYRYIDTAVESGTPFPVYPTDMAELTEGVKACIRDYLNDLPVAAAIEPERQRALKRRIESDIPRLVQMRYYAHIAILLFIALPSAEFTSLDTRFKELLAHLGTGRADEWDRQVWVEEARRLAPLVERQGGYVPWIELEAYGVQPKRLTAGAALDTPSASEQGGEQSPD
jgi:hypothetical protein